MVPVVLAAGYFALWACATPGPATLRTAAPPPPGEKREVGLGGFVAKDNYGDLTGGGAIWWTRHMWRFDLGYTIQGGGQGVGPTFTARLWMLDASRFRLGVGGELGTLGAMGELPVAVNAFGPLWLYGMPRLTTTPTAAWAAGGLVLRLSRVGVIVEGGDAVYMFASQSPSFTDLAMRYYGAGGLAIYY